MEEVKNFQRNYLESEKFFSKFSYFLERENFQNLNCKICKIKLREIMRPKSVKVKNFQRNYLVSEKFFTKFSFFFESEIFQNME